MRIVEGGNFRMGTDESELEAIRIAIGLSNTGPLAPEVPSRQVQVEDFYLDTLDVTNGDFAEFVNARPAWSKNELDPSDHNGRYLEHWTDAGPPTALLDHPVTFITWSAAAAYCDWKGKRLPTEIEYEWASRDGRSRAMYPWGDEPPNDTLVNWGGNGIDTTVPVGSYPPNARGLYDMSGNVWHFTADPWLGSYADMAAMESPPPVDERTRRVVRGGSYGANAANLRVRYRDSHRPFDAREMVGFRCARSAERDAPLSSAELVEEGRDAALALLDSIGMAYECDMQFVSAAIVIRDVDSVRTEFVNVDYSALGSRCGEAASMLNYRSRETGLRFRRVGNARPRTDVLGLSLDRANVVSPARTDRLN
ncbi:MAG: SUMF1/EgtB/PvdO family nonheme iron enzyme [Pseudomonadota bacterium]